MPITLTISEGLLSADTEAEVFAGLTYALWRVAQLSGNHFMTRNVVGSSNILPKNRIFSGGEPVPAAFIELKLPEIALATPEARQDFITEATTIAGEGRLSRDHIWTNVYAVDGAWGIAGRAYSNAELVGAIQSSAAD